MRNLQESRNLFANLDRLNSLNDYKEAVKVEKRESLEPLALRSIYWRVFLLFGTVDRRTWARTTTGSRDGYSDLRAHLLKKIQDPDELESSIDPLSDNGPSPWNALRQDEALRAEILQDVERCMPENVYFEQPSTQRILLDILFVFCKLNPDIGYKQGMHELLAPVLWVIESDAISFSDVNKSELNEDDSESILLCLLDSNYIEHDAFVIFNIIMQNAKTFYEVKPALGSRPKAPSSHRSSYNDEPPIINRINKIYRGYLSVFDPGLATHLHDLDIGPQIFLLKWIRLLFGREFALDDVLSMWDLLFAEDASLEMVDTVCVAMILRIRWELIDSSLNKALDLLLHYPQSASNGNPQTFISDAVYLSKHMTSTGGSFIIMKYSGHAPSVDHEVVWRSISAPNLEPQKSPSSLFPRKGPSRSPVSGNIEYYLQDAAHGLYIRGQKLGIAKVVQDAVGEVRKNVQAIASPENEARLANSYGDLSIAGSSEILRGISALQERNKALANMLASAVDELWECEKTIGTANQKPYESENTTKNLSAAIAKVQFVQVFLEDPSIEVPGGSLKRTEEDAEQFKGLRTDQGDSNTKREMPLLPNKINDGSASEVKAVDSNMVSATEPDIFVSPCTVQRQEDTKGEQFKPHKRQTSTKVYASRPPLTQSSFSWMVNTEVKGSSFVDPGPTPTEKRRGRGSRGFLFGEDDAEQISAKTKAKDRTGGNVEAKPEVINLHSLK